MNVFISHSWTYSDHYDKLAEWIFEENWESGGISIKFNNTSVPKYDPIHYAKSDKELREAIYSRIILSDVMVVPTGMYANHSKWIKKEIEGAGLFGKPIVAVNPWAQKRASSIVGDAAVTTVGWTKQSIISAVWEFGQRG